MIKLPNIKGLVAVGKTFIVANRPEILLGASVAATIGSTVLAAKGGYKARGIIDEANLEREQEGAPELDVKEKIQLTWLCYVPAAVACTTAVGSISGLHLVHIKEKKALATAALAALEEVKKEAQGYISEDGTEIDFEKVSNEDGVAEIKNSDGDIEEFYLVRDMKTGRDIWSNQNRIESAVNAINAILTTGEDVELNHFYSLAGYNLIPDGDDYGWSGESPTLVWGQSVRDDGRPVRTFEFRPLPRENFYRANR